MEKILENFIVLLVEDDKGHAALVRKNLWRICIDARIIHFSDGGQLLAFFKGEVHEGERFEPGKYFVLLDIKMPGIDGIETLRQIKASPNLSPIPVIMLTTAANPIEIHRCYEYGCAFYIVKPPDYIEFMNGIEILGTFLSLPSQVISAVGP